MALPSPSSSARIASWTGVTRGRLLSRGHKPVESSARSAGIKSSSSMFNYEQLGDAVLFCRLPPPLNSGRTGRLLASSVEVPALRFNDVDVQVRNIDVTRAQTLRRVLTGIGPAAGVRDLVAASMRQWESRVAAANGRQLG